MTESKDKVVVELTSDEVKIILLSLADKPYKKVVSIIDKIKSKLSKETK
jgi:hypothetical protein